MGFLDDDLFDDEDDFSAMDNTSFDYSNDDFSLDGFGSSNDGTSSFDNQNNNDSMANWGTDSNTDDAISQTDSGKKEILKSSVIFIIAGILVLIIVAVLAGILKNKKESDTSSSNNYSGEAVITSDEYNTTSDSYNTTSDNVNTTNGNQYNSNSDNRKNDWQKFDSTNEIQFISEPVNLSFTVTKVENYVKFVNDSNDMMVKTIATGALDGYTGTYEVELPYDKGSLLQPGAKLLVNVQVGEYKGMSVVGELVII
ncbi:MAG: hypothetical protein J6A59_06430 [Lachnospiraceae bacterium]|nr:hypothetical protein [Lachnospiraceae bacterium]